MHRKVVLVALSLLFALAIAVPASAITWGTPDGEAHPHVGLMVFDVGGAPAWRCSGTLLSPTVMLTAGHCTFGTTGGRVYFDADVGAGRPGNGYPFSGGISFAEIHTHPSYVDAAFYLHDVGVVILSGQCRRLRHGAGWAAGPALNAARPARAKLHRGRLRLAGSGAEPERSPG